MSKCEKCWRDAGGSADRYGALIEERKESPCAPEESAGPESVECPLCERRTIHQWTGECMVFDCAYEMPGNTLRLIQRLRSRVEQLEQEMIP